MVIVTDDTKIELVFEKAEMERGGYADAPENGLSEEDLDLLTRIVVTPKMLQLLGDERLLPRKARSFFGADGGLEPIARQQRNAQRRAQIEEINRRRTQKQKYLNQILKQRPTDEQKRIPLSSKSHVSPKALRIFGDEELTRQSLQVVTPEMRKNVNAKTIDVFGEPSCLMTRKQQQLFGIDKPSQPKPTTSWFASFRHKVSSKFPRIQILV